MGHPGNWSARKTAAVVAAEKAANARADPGRFTVHRLLFYGHRLIAICKTCRRAQDVSCQQLDAMGLGSRDIRGLPLVCSECGSRQVLAGIRK